MQLVVRGTQDGGRALEEGGAVAGVLDDEALYDVAGALDLGGQAGDEFGLVFEPALGGATDAEGGTAREYARQLLYLLVC